MNLLVNTINVRDNTKEITEDTMGSKRKEIDLQDIIERIVSMFVDEGKDEYEIEKVLSKEGYVSRTRQKPFSAAYIRDQYHKNKSRFGKRIYQKRSISKAETQKIDLMKSIAGTEGVDDAAKFKVIKEILDTL